MKTKKQLDKPINFDDFASNYENYIAQSFGTIDNNLNYYHSAKAKILKKELNQNPERILDFGCGIGLMLSHLKESFKESKFYAYDDSSKSLDYIKAKYKDVSCINSLDISIKFNLIFVSNVIHHVKSTERNDLFKKIYDLLDNDGRLFIIEHNPYNPLTLRTVANCEFDVDAELIKKKKI